MPKPARYMLTWSAEGASYELRDGLQAMAAGDAKSWARWLDEHGSFSFRGREGRLTLLKEGRKGGAGYWYAYRRRGARTAKRYAGRAGELTFARLEELARALADSGGPPVVPQLADRVIAQAGSGSGIAAPEPLLAPKLQPPRLHRALVRRERLLAQLDAGREGKLTLVNGPAGFGKTTLVRQWLAETARSGAAPIAAWLALDPGDNDPLRFWRYLISACRAFGPAVGAQSLALLESPLSIKSPLEMSRAALVNELAQARSDGILVLEDYHVITTPQIHEAVGFLLDHLPPRLHLLLITRTDPPLPLVRLRAAGELTEIEAPDLRFSPAETAAFFHQATALSLPAGDLAQVEAHIEGWVAGLRLLALALAGHQDAGEIHRILANVIAGPRGIGDYFVAEVLNNQPAPLQLFLLQTSFLGRLTAALCDSVCGQDNSQALLELLDRANLFVEPLDAAGLWYRYHTLFAAAMQREAWHRLGAEAVRVLLERAGRWYEEHAMLSEAIETAFAADDVPRAVRLIEIVAGRQLSFDLPELHEPPEFFTLQRWLIRLPEAIMDERPLLNLSLAIGLLFTNIMNMRPPFSLMGSEIERLLVKAEGGFRAAGATDRLGQVFAFRSLVLRERGEIAAGVRAARAALDLLPAQELSWRSICVGALGLGESNAGHLGDAAARFAEARAMCEVLGNRPFARANTGMQAMVLVEQNELHRAAALFRRMLAEARAVGDLDDVGHGLRGLAEIALCWNDLDAAWAQATEVVEATRQYPHEPSHIHAVLILARVEQARGQNEAALARCRALMAGRLPAILQAEKQLTAQIEFEQARIALAAGDLAAVQRWHAARPGDLEISRTEHHRAKTLLAHLLLAEGAAKAALHLLEPLLPSAEADGRGRVALEIRVALALAYAACDQPQRARHMLGAALATARPENAVRVFIDAGAPLAALLRATLPALSDKPLRAFAQTILRATTGVPAAAPVPAEPLSPQEHRVLRLLVAGRSNLEIAADLVVSVNTVKAHVKNIYRKLNVGSRLAAADAARDLSLL